MLRLAAEQFPGSYGGRFRYGDAVGPCLMRIMWNRKAGRQCPLAKAFAAWVAAAVRQPGLQPVNRSGISRMDVALVGLSLFGTAVPGLSIFIWVSSSDDTRGGIHITVVIPAITGLFVLKGGYRCRGGSCFYGLRFL